MQLETMKVKELIEKLQECDPDALLIGIYEGSFCSLFDSVTQGFVYLTENGFILEDSYKKLRKKMDAKKVKCVYLLENVDFAEGDENE